MADTWTGKVATTPGVYADGDQKVTLRIEPSTPKLLKGDLVTVTRMFLPISTTPTPAPPPPPVGGQQTLQGGWTLGEQYMQGCFAIDFSRMKLWVGQVYGGSLSEYDLPAMGSGTNPASWPRLTPVRTINGWWPNFSTTGASNYEGVATYVNGLIWWRNKLWAAPKVFYAQNPSPVTTLHAQDGEVITIPLERQVFAGFVKRGPGLDPFIGCGGYESGGSSQSSGPSLATLSGQVLLRYQWPALPGANLEHWNLRAPRDTNYSVNDPGHEWVGWTPRLINGVLEGRWTIDRVFGGGLALSDGYIHYWGYLATGALSYAEMQLGHKDPLTYRYRYNATTYQFVDFSYQPEFTDGPVLGQEIGPDGKVYLARGGKGGGGSMFGNADLQIRVYG